MADVVSRVNRPDRYSPEWFRALSRDRLLRRQRVYLRLVIACEVRKRSGTPEFQAARADRIRSLIALLSLFDRELERRAPERVREYFRAVLAIAGPFYGARVPEIPEDRLEEVGNMNHSSAREVR